MTLGGKDKGQLDSARAIIERALSNKHRIATSKEYKLRDIYMLEIFALEKTGEGDDDDHLVRGGGEGGGSRRSMDDHRPMDRSNDSGDGRRRSRRGMPGATARVLPWRPTFAPAHYLCSAPSYPPATVLDRTLSESRLSN